MTIKEFKTEELIDELVARGAQLIENKLYQDSKVCLCRTKYSKDDDLKVLGRVLVLEDVEWYFYIFSDIYSNVYCAWRWRLVWWRLNLILVFNIIQEVVYRKSEKQRKSQYV